MARWLQRLTHWLQMTRQELEGVLTQELVAPEDDESPSARDEDGPRDESESESHG